MATRSQLPLVDCTPVCPPDDPSPDLRPVEGRDAERDLVLFAKALAHPARLQILKFLIRKQSCQCGRIVDEIGLAQATVSQHLKVLKTAGLIRGEVDGPRVCYCVDARGLRRLKAICSSL
jgi:ArsR family transcriptional regulator, arsenate/arsenite/antimonite-responsive transcriptional repressor